jgi:TRAP-type C4-dicarboxylate transport system permease small subunit
MNRRREALAVTRFIRVVEGVLSWLMRVLCFTTGMALAITLLMGVFVRYVIKGSLPWSGELPSFLFPWFVMGGATLAALKNQHLGFDYIMGKVKKPAQRWALVGVQTLVIVSLLWVALISLKVLGVFHLQRSPVLDWPQSWSFASLPLGLVVLTLGVGIRALKLIFNLPLDAELPVEG